MFPGSMGALPMDRHHALLRYHHALRRALLKAGSLCLPP